MNAHVKPAVTAAIDLDLVGTNLFRIQSLAFAAQSIVNHEMSPGEDRQSLSTLLALIEEMAKQVDDVLIGQPVGVNRLLKTE